LNVIRFLANDLKLPLVCAGTDLARQALLTAADFRAFFESIIPELVDQFRDQTRKP
jgi:hypothetical protein